MKSRLNTLFSWLVSQAAGRSFSFPMGLTSNQENSMQELAVLNAKENGMLLFLVNKLRQLNTDELTFFRVAHVWAFGTDPDLHDDVAQFKLHGVVPVYVKNYLKTLQ